MTDFGPARTGPSSYGLGIDLGTMRTTAAICDCTGPRVATVVPLGAHGDAMATLVAIGADGSVEVGGEAAATPTDSRQVLRDIKRFVGDPAPLAAPNWTPERLIARLVDHVVGRVSARQGLAPSRITLAVPTCWGDDNRRLIKEAVAERDLAVTLVSGVEAAGEQYAATRWEHGAEPIAVYDFGGGFFDAAVLRSESGSGVTLAGPPEGSDRIGGIDLDDLVVDHVCTAVPATSPMAADLWNSCASAKESLTTGSTALIHIDEQSEAVALDRTGFELMIHPLVAQTVALLQRAIASAGITPKALSEVVLLGGSARIPLVAHQVSAALGRPVSVHPDTDALVALGAALLAARPVPGAAGLVGPPARTFESPLVPPRRAGVWRRGRPDGPRRTTIRLRRPETAGSSRPRGARRARVAPRPSVRLWSAFPAVPGRGSGPLRSRRWSMLLPAMLLGASLTAVAAVALAAVAGGTTSLAATPIITSAGPDAVLTTGVPPTTTVDPGITPPASAPPTRTTAPDARVARPSSTSTAAAAGGPARSARSVRPVTPTAVPAAARVVPAPVVPAPVVPAPVVPAPVVPAPVVTAAGTAAEAARAASITPSSGSAPDVP